MGFLNRAFAALLLAAMATLAVAHREPEPGQAERARLSFIGERLVYKIDWDPPWYLFFLPRMEAGEVELQMSGDAEYNGKKAVEVRVKARSSGTLAKLAGVRIEDEFVFLTDPDTLCTWSSSSKIREGNRKRQIDVRYLRESRQLHIRELDEAVAPSKVKKDETKNDIPECVHDPFSALYLFRQSQLRDRYSRTFTLANDDKIKEVKALVEKQETVQGPYGKIAAWRVVPSALMGGLFKEGGQFRIWFSADEKKVPVQFEVKARLGHVLGSLKPAS